MAAWVASSGNSMSPPGEVEELRPEEADAVGAVLEDVRDLAGELDVGPDRDLLAVPRPGDAAEASLLEGPLAGASRSRRSSEEGEDVVGGLAPDDALPAVDDDPVALPDRREELRHADDRRKAERAGQDGGVRRRAPALGREARRPGRAESGRRRTASARRRSGRCASPVRSSTSSWRVALVAEVLFGRSAPRRRGRPPGAPDPRPGGPGTGPERIGRRLRRPTRR